VSPHTVPAAAATRKPLALITGASAGIGYELALCFAQNGHDLVIVARRAESLQRLAEELKAKYDCTAHVCVADLSHPSAPAEIHAFTSNKNIIVDVLVNNAGFGANGAFQALDLKTQMEMIQVNITALVELTHRYLPQLVQYARAGTGVMNIASTAAFIPGPFMAVYYATKAFVLSFSAALSNEMRGTGVTVCCVCPGATTTEFQERANLSKSKLFNGRVMTAGTVAREAYAGYAAGQSVVVTGMVNKMAAFSSRFVPRAVAADLARSLQGPQKP